MGEPALRTTRAVWYAINLTPPPLHVGNAQSTIWGHFIWLSSIIHVTMTIAKIWWQPLLLMQAKKTVLKVQSRSELYLAFISWTITVMNWRNIAGRRKTEGVKGWLTPCCHFNLLVKPALLFPLCVHMWFFRMLGSRDVFSQWKHWAVKDTRCKKSPDPPIPTERQRA